MKEAVVVEKAGFAKVAATGSESLFFAQQFVDNTIEPRSFVNTAGGSAFKGLKRGMSTMKSWAQTPYRFSRRHEPDLLFFRALSACARATHFLEPVLFG